MQTNKPLLLTYPSSNGDFGRYTNEDQRSYFHKFPGGVTEIVRLAVNHRLQGDFIAYHEDTTSIFNNSIEPIEGLITPEHYASEQRSFHRRCFDIWRFITTAMVNVDTTHYKVDTVNHSPNGQRISFLLK